MNKILRNIFFKKSIKTYAPKTLREVKGDLNEKNNIYVHESIKIGLKW